MKLVCFSTNNSARIQHGILDGDQVYLYAWDGTVQSLVERNIHARPTHESFDVDTVQFKAPLKPGKIIGVGRNYAAHAEELNNAIPEEPLLFAKFTSSITDPGAPIRWHTGMTTQVDWEGELAVVIGRAAKDIAPEDAYHHIYGYTIANDVSARDLQDNDKQWVRAKGLDTFCPLGPAIVTKDAIPDPHALTITTTVNGETMQHDSTGLMLFKIPDLVAYCSQAFTLHPGDVILTGTPAGVGKAQKPPRFLEHGDTVSVQIEGIGTLTNPCEQLDR